MTLVKFIIVRVIQEQHAEQITVVAVMPSFIQKKVKKQIALYLVSILIQKRSLMYNKTCCEALVDLQVKSRNYAVIGWLKLSPQKLSKVGWGAGTLSRCLESFISSCSADKIRWIELKKLQETPSLPFSLLFTTSFLYFFYLFVAIVLFCQLMNGQVSVK